MKAIKGLVLFMGILLIAGLVLLGYGLYGKAKRIDAGAPAGSSSPATQFGKVEVPLPAGSRVEQVLSAGQRVVLRVTGAGAERFIVLDPADGRVAGQFVLSPEAPAPR